MLKWWRMWRADINSQEELTMLVFQSLPRNTRKGSGDVPQGKRLMVANNPLNNLNLSNHRWTDARQGRGTEAIRREHFHTRRAWNEPVEWSAKGREALGCVNPCWGVSGTARGWGEKEGAPPGPLVQLSCFMGAQRLSEGQTTPYVTLLDFNVPTYNFLSLLLLGREQPNLNYYY